MTIGSKKRTSIQKAKDRANDNLFFENRKNEIPTIPYNFSKNPAAIKKAAQKSLRRSMYIRENYKCGNQAIYFHIFNTGHHFNQGYRQDNLLTFIIQW